MNPGQRDKIKQLPIGELKKTFTLEELLRRPELTVGRLETIFPELFENYSVSVKSAVETKIKYKGYIERQKSQAKKYLQENNIKIPENFNFDAISGLSNEIKEKIKKVSPVTIGQLSRIKGMTPAAVSIVLVYLKRHGNEQ